MSFEDNIGHEGNLPLVAYMDFETTAATDNCFNPEQKTITQNKILIESLFRGFLDIPIKKTQSAT